MKVGEFKAFLSHFLKANIQQFQHVSPWDSQPGFPRNPRLSAVVHEHITFHVVSLVALKKHGKTSPERRWYFDV